MRYPFWFADGDVGHPLKFFKTKKKVVETTVARHEREPNIPFAFFTEPPADAPDVLPPGSLTLLAVALSLAITFVLGTFPQPVLELVDAATGFLS
jgi:NADH-quinone oxidoreductase subunit N